MSDSYMTIATIAADNDMQQRMIAAATQQSHLGSAPAITEPQQWVMDNRYVWASSPGWGAKWDYARQTNWDDSDYQPGRDPAVITDADILATVQALGNETE
jgi:hypothetical protein